MGAIPPYTKETMVADSEYKNIEWISVADATPEAPKFTHPKQSAWLTVIDGGEEKTGWYDLYYKKWFSPTGKQLLSVTHWRAIQWKIT